MGRSGSEGTHVIQNHHGLGPATLGFADGVEDAMANHRREDLLNEEGEQDSADGGEVEVMDQEQRA